MLLSIWQASFSSTSQVVGPLLRGLPESNRHPEVDQVQQRRFRTGAGVHGELTALGPFYDLLTGDRQGESKPQQFKGGPRP